MIQSPGCSEAAFAASRRSASARESTPSKRTCVCQRSTARVKCMWLSMSPGITVAPATSKTRVAGPTRRAISALVPLATMRPSSMASAWTMRKSASTVRILPLVTTVSTACAPARPQAKVARKNPINRRRAGGMEILLWAVSLDVGDDVTGGHLRACRHVTRDAGPSFADYRRADAATTMAAWYPSSS
jgi:hypothetical protein